MSNSRVRRTGVGSLVTAASVALALAMAFSASAQEAPNIEEESARRGPTSEQLRAYEEEFGGPPEFVSQPEVAVPEYEEPGTVPADVRSQVKDSDLVAIYCATARWKSGGFFAAMDALKKYLIPAIDDAKELGIDVDVPNPDDYKAQGQQKLDAICSAQRFDDAERLTREFSDWGRGEPVSIFNGLNVSLQGKMAEEGDKIRREVRAAVDAKVAELKAKYQAEIEAQAEQLANDAKASFEGRTSPPTEEEIASVRSRIESQVESLVAKKRAEAEPLVNAAANAALAGRNVKFEKAGKSFEGMDKEINADIAAAASQYEQYRQEAFRLRKAAVFGLLDRSVEDGLKQLDEASAEIESARKDEPSLPTVGQIRADLQKERQALEASLDAALAKGDETAFQDALNAFRTKWENYRREMEKAAAGSMNKACTVALAQFDQAKPQVATGLTRISDLLSKCANSVSDECLKVQEFASRLGALSKKLSDIQLEISTAEAMCAAPSDSNRQNLTALLRKIQSDAEDAKDYGAALESDKQKAIADSVSKACAQALPQLDAAKTEISRNDLGTIDSNIARCKNKTAEECRVVNGMAEKVEKYRTRVKAFLTEIDDARKLCAAPNEENFDALRSLLNALKADGDVVRALGKELLAEQAEKASEKALCRAVVPQYQGVRSQVGSGIKEMSSVQSGCAAGNDPRCSAINGLKPKFDAVRSQGEALLQKITALEGICNQAGSGVPGQAIMSLLEGLRSDEPAFRKAIDELKAESDQAGRGQGIWIEAESDTRNYILPASKRPAKNTKEAAPAWRPPFFGSGDWYLAAGGEWLGYDFTVTEPGRYQIWVRDYVDKFQARGIRRITIEINGKNYGTFAEVDKPAPGDKGAFGWHKVGLGVDLKAGKNTLKVIKESTTRGAAILDAFYLTNGSEVPPEK